MNSRCCLKTCAIPPMRPRWPSASSHSSRPISISTAASSLPPSASGLRWATRRDTSKDLLRNADTAMYYAKTRGKARFEIFDEGMRGPGGGANGAGIGPAQGDRSKISSWCITSRKFPWRPARWSGTRRWSGGIIPRRGIVMPGEFLPVAEETGLIVPLGRWVMREACRQMAEWHRNFPQEPPLTISVNASSRELADPDLVPNVARILRETGLDPGSLRIEVTESSIVENQDLTATTLRRLQETRRQSGDRRLRNRLFLSQPLA